MWNLSITIGRVQMYLVVGVVLVLSTGTRGVLGGVAPLAIQIRDAASVGLIELQPNGTITLRSNGTAADAHGHGHGAHATNQQLALVQGLVNALKMAQPEAGQQPSSGITDEASTVPVTAVNKWMIKIYGDGVEHKFPLFLERIVQRIQSYFSIYKYTDTSRPVRQELQATTYTTHGTHSASASTPSSSTPSSSTSSSSTTTTTTITYMPETSVGVSYSEPASIPTTTTFIDIYSEDYPEFIAIDDKNDRL